MSRTNRITVPDSPIFRRRRKIKCGHFVIREGKLVPARIGDLVCHDSVNIRSMSTGIHPDQIPEAMRRFGHLGVKYDPITGDAIYRDRNSKLAVLKARGYVDNDEVRGGQSRRVCGA